MPTGGGALLQSFVSAKISQLTQDFAGAEVYYVQHLISEDIPPIINHNYFLNESRSRPYCRDCQSFYL